MEINSNVTTTHEPDLYAIDVLDRNGLQVGAYLSRDHARLLMVDLAEWLSEYRLPTAQSTRS